MYRLFLFFGIYLLILTSFAEISVGQNETSSNVSGSISDANGALIPGANIEFVDTATSHIFTAATDDNGYFVLTRIPLGKYRVTVTKTGFRPLRIPVYQTEITKSYVLNLEMEVGSFNETVEVNLDSGAQLQRSDAAVGTVISPEQLLRLPNANRSAAALFALQPLIAPTRNAPLFQGGQVGGIRSDQSTFILDGADATDFATGNNFYTSGTIDFSGPGPVIPVPAESIEEFRVTVSNSSAATFGSSSGGQTLFVTKRGTNLFHGSGYIYHQNDKFNANSWDFNRAGIKKQPFRDNRFGASFGGPLWKDRAFFFGHYEGRRFSRSVGVSRLVPTQTLKNGILRFRDATGQVISYNAQTFDPRNIGINPLIRSFWNLLPDGNDATVAGSDGLNTIGFFAPVELTNQLDFGVARFDYILNSKWTLYGTYRQSSQLSKDSTQLDIAGLVPGNVRGTATSVASTPVKPRLVSLKITGLPTSKMVNEFSAAFLSNLWAFKRARPSPQVTGTNGALLVAQTLLDQGIDVDTQRARSRIWEDKSWQFGDSISWELGKTSLQFGTTWQHTSIFHERDDKVIGSLTALVYEINSSVTSIPAGNRPPLCTGGTTTNCLNAGDTARFNDLFAASLGIMSRAGILTTRDANLNLLAPGTPLQINGSMESFTFYGNAIRKLRSDLVLNVGIVYSLETPPFEKNGKQTVLTDQTTGRPVIARDYLNARMNAALNGGVYNPTLSYIPIRNSQRNSIYDLDPNNFSPRVSIAWSPHFKSGLLGRIIGNDKTVLRSGYSVNFDRINGSEINMIPALGVGFSQTINCTGPLLSGGCNGTSTLANAFRIGIDGSGIILTAPQSISSPVIPVEGRSPGETLSFSIDPHLKNGYSHNVNFSWQRELPWKMILEAGYVGNFGRSLVQNVQLNSIPFFMKDSASGQTFAEAYDAVAKQLRAGTAPGLVTPQPWFENQLGGSPFCGMIACTVALVTGQSANFVQGGINAIFNVINNERPAGPIINRQSTSFFVKTNGGLSNYHALFISVNKQFSTGLLFSANYTLSRSHDQYGLNQVSTGVNSTSYDFDVDYGPSLFDRTHVFNSNWYYDLPFVLGAKYKTGALGKILDDWYFSGIFTAQSGVPLTIGQQAQVYGGDPLNFAITAGAIPLGPINNSGSIHIVNTTGGNVGINGNPTNGGTGMNLFSNPQEVYNNFRYISLSADKRHGRGILRGIPRWNIDLSLGKKITITEKFRAVITLDALNALNRVEFEDPDLDLRRPANFGVITRQFGSPRTLQFGLRLEF